MRGKNNITESQVLDIDSEKLINIKVNQRKISILKSRKIKFIVVIIITIFSLLLVSYVYLYFKNNNTLPLPIAKDTASLLGYDIYYPNQNLLPNGYVLNKNSFNENSQAIVYSVNYGNNSKIVFTNQLKPSESQIQEFYAKHMPLHSTLQTNIGTATIGAINGQTVVSLPTNTNAWILMTAPSNINQDELKQVLKSIEIAK